MDIGVIEGFYGQSWSHQERLAMIEFLAQWQFQSYWYAPKDCRKLRNEWAVRFDDVELDELAALSRKAKEEGVAFGVGLSLIGLAERWKSDATAKDQLLVKLQQLSQVGCHEVGILFDDMRGDCPQLAELQVEMVHFVIEHLNCNRQVFCPTYYSFDPVLNEVFGEKPKGYLSNLGQWLDPKVDIFWTGKRVVSSDYDDCYSAEHLSQVAEFLKRKPILWDNSRVSDGRLTSPFLPLNAMFEPAALEGLVNGIMVNPMNPPALARINLQTLKLVGASKLRLQQAMNNQGADLSDCLSQYLNEFRSIGLDALPDDTKAEMIACFSRFDHPVANDVMRWLDGDFVFDPACLT